MFCPGVMLTTGGPLIVTDAEDVATPGIEAVTWKVPLNAPAVYVPSLWIVPPVAFHTIDPPPPVTVAANRCTPPGAMFVVLGETTIEAATPPATSRRFRGAICAAAGCTRTSGAIATENPQIH